MSLMSITIFCSVKRCVLLGKKRNVYKKTLCAGYLDRTPNAVGDIIYLISCKKSFRQKRKSRYRRLRESMEARSSEWVRFRHLWYRGHIAGIMSNYYAEHLANCGKHPRHRCFEYTSCGWRLEMCVSRSALYSCIHRCSSLCTNTHSSNAAANHNYSQASRIILAMKAFELRLSRS